METVFPFLRLYFSLPSYPQILAGWRRLLPLAGFTGICRVAKLNNNVYLCGEINRLLTTKYYYDEKILLFISDNFGKHHDD